MKDVTAIGNIFFFSKTIWNEGDILYVQLTVNIQMVFHLCKVICCNSFETKTVLIVLNRNMDDLCVTFTNENVEWMNKSKSLWQFYHLTVLVRHCVDRNQLKTKSLSTCLPIQSKTIVYNYFKYTLLHHNYMRINFFEMQM